MTVQARARIPVLLYHRIDREKDPVHRSYCIDPDVFEKQMAWLKKEGYTTISLTDLQQYYQQGGSVPERSIVLTFDDGFYCNYTRAYPILQQQEFIATIFLTTDLIRNPVPVAESKDSFLSWDEIKEMYQAGFSFQSHGCSHRPLDTISLEEVSREAHESKASIEKALRTEVKYFCYPFSRFNEAIKRIIKREGYIGACGGPPFWQDGPRDWFEIGRTEILWSDSFAQFRFKVKRGLGYYYFTKRQLGKLKKKFLMTHAHTI
ncbi:MAG: polysaccharide deacetylase family protein [bacterium]